MRERRHLVWRRGLALVVVALAGGLLDRGGLAQVAGRASRPSATKPAVRAEPTGSVAALLEAIEADPLTAPFRFRVESKDGRPVLSGRVGTKQAHDAAIRTAIALGVPVRDDLVIDTTEAYRAAALGQWNGTGVPTGLPAPPYIYPPPLMGRLDEPFYGFEPPLVSYPPWWGAVASREPIHGAALAPDAMAMAGGPAPAGTPGAVELTLDTRGVAFLRGTVRSLSERVEIGQKIARTRGISHVVNLLEVDPGVPSISDTPPPPPVPATRGREPSRTPPPPRADPPPAPAEDRPITPAPIAADSAELSRRVSQSMARRPALASLPVRVATREGVTTLTGKVPSAYEAMLAFRAAEQTPGVREVNDRLEFEPPDIDRPNPLREKGRPEDLEPYLLAHLRRQLGELAHVDRLRVSGDAVEVRGTVASPADVPRVEATLRSIPLLRGFRLESKFVPE
jgi:osmotically-inducible protein OsmY